MTSGIKIGACHNISQRVIVSSDQEGLVQQLFLRVLHNGPFQHQELEFGGMIVLFMGCEGPVAYGNWALTLSPSCHRQLGDNAHLLVFWESTAPSPSLEASVLSRKILSVVSKD